MGALIKRDPPLSGLLGDTPLGKYRISRWGALLLIVILIAPAVQLTGDLLKDHFKDIKDAQTMSATVDEIEKGVASSTITGVQAIKEASDKQVEVVNEVLHTQQTLSGQTSGVAAQATRTLGEVERGLYPLRDVEWSYELEFNLKGERFSGLTELLRQKLPEHPGWSATPDGNNRIYETLWPPTNPFGPTSISVDMFSEPHVISGDGFFDVIGPSVLVDFFEQAPNMSALSNMNLSSGGYHATLDRVINGAFLRMEHPEEKLNRLDGTRYQLIYFPASDSRPDTDRLFVDYFRRLPDYFQFVTAQTYVGLSDLVNNQFVVRMETNHDSVKSNASLNEFAGAESLYRLNEIRMRVGNQEIVWHSSDFQSYYVRGCCLVYKTTMPGRFEDLRKRLSPVFTEEDESPLFTLRPTVHKRRPGE